MATRKKGKVILVGDVKIDFPRSPFYEKEIDFCISCSYGAGRYDSSYEMSGIDYPYSYVRWTENRNMQLISELMCSGKLKVNELIYQEFSINQFENAYESLKNKKYLGAILSYPSCPMSAAARLPPCTRYPSRPRGGGWPSRNRGPSPSHGARR